MGGGWEQTCMLSPPQVFLPLPFLLQYTVPASYLRLAIQRHKIAIPLSVAWPQLTSSCSAQKRQEPEALPWRRWVTKVRVEQTTQQFKGLEKVVPALVDLSLASLCSDPTFPSPHLTTDQKRSRHQQDICPCVLGVKPGTSALMAAAQTWCSSCCCTAGIHNESLLWMCEPRLPGIFGKILSLLFFRLNNHNSLRCPSTFILAEVLARIAPVCSCLPCFEEPSVDRPL